MTCQALRLDLRKLLIAHSKVFAFICVYVFVFVYVLNVYSSYYICVLILLLCCLCMNKGLLVMFFSDTHIHTTHILVAQGLIHS